MKRNLKITAVGIVQGLRGDSETKNAAMVNMITDIERTHQHTLRTLAPALNEALKHHCLAKYSKVMGNLKWVRTRAQYDDRHENTFRRVKAMLSNVRLLH
jgi:hypothetical protein